jgi:deoxycytidylate deaminase/dephospho-CoA kinase
MEQQNSIDIISQIYELRQNFIVIGLTGRTGSGCTAVAELCKNENFSALYSPIPTTKLDGLTNDERKYKIVYNFLKQNWKPFEVIKASDIIVLFVLIDTFESFAQAFQETDQKATVDNTKEQDLLKKIKDDGDYAIWNEEAIVIYELLKEEGKINLKELSEEDKKRIIDLKKFIFEKIPEIRKKIEKTINRKLTVELQLWGDNIRKYNSSIQKNTIAPNAPSALAEMVNKIIKLLRALNSSEKKPTLAMIDALRNPYEILYFRERYSSFYLMSVNTLEKIRKENLHKLDYKDTDIIILDEKEHPTKSKDIESSFYSQDIERCVELSDILVVHNGQKIEENFDLKKQIITYVSLMKHPGIIPPSPQERVMQIAFGAKLNSGCISRQVGAAVTDEHFSIKSIGWNTVPEGQTPCSLRNFEDLYIRSDLNAFSSFEKSNPEFRTVIENLHFQYDAKRDEYLKFKEKGHTHSFCFKDFYITLTMEKNQVYTRSLHAEENAFLQLVKYGTKGIKGGKLFTTASPCELCAKKAYQLGIKEIYYIDAYPGISMEHILDCGDNKPQVFLFHGAIGRAYDSLYNPLMSYKDEIAYLTKVKIGKGTSKEQEPDSGSEKKRLNNKLEN